MRLKKLRLFLGCLFAITTFSMSFPCNVYAEWKAGASSALITPSEPMWTAGYAGRTEPAREVISDLYVKALVIQDPSGKTFVIVTADLIGYPDDFVLEITKEAEKKWGLPRRSIIFNASHTHCGPEIRGWPVKTIHRDYIPDDYFAKMGPYREWLHDKIIEIIDTSIKNLSPSNITFSSIRPVPFAVSRRFPDGKGGVLYRSSPSSYYTEGPRDDTVPVLTVTGLDGAVKAILFGYACHPITLSHNAYSGDYPGYAQEYIEEAFPGAVALFMQGCSGELVPNSRQQIEYAMGHGRALADAVKRAVEGPQTNVTGPIKTSYKEVTLNFAPLTREVLEHQIETGHARVKAHAGYLMEKIALGEEIKQTLSVPLQAISFGQELLMVGFPGETVVDYSVNSKNEFSDSAKFVWASGYNNFGFGYLPTLNILREGGYEASETLRSPTMPGPLAEDVENIIMEGMRDLVNTVTR